MHRNYCLLIICFLWSFGAFAWQPTPEQDTDTLQPARQSALQLMQQPAVHLPALPGDTVLKRMVQIADVEIEGNKRTREYVIRREMSLLEGEVVALEELEELIALNKKRISNTRLFNNVDISVLPIDDKNVKVSVNLQERWYVVPAPIFKLADRNFNDWWTNQNRDMSRVNYGLKFKHYNFMGRAEQLALVAQFGYTRSFKVGYYLPYIDKSRKTGLGLNFLYFENNNVALRSINHKRVFLNDNERQLRKVYSGSMSFSRRSSFYTTHYAALSFNANTVADTVVIANPEYMPESDRNLRFFSLIYGISRDLRDNVSYPLKGFVLRGAAIQRGLGIFNQVNIFEIEGSFSYFKPLAKRLFFSNSVSARLSVPDKQPYYLQRGLGFGMEYVRGMELYVVEGQHYFLNKSDFKWQMFKHEFDLSNIIPWEQFNKVPLLLYPKVYFDVAYVSVKNPLPNNNLLLNKPIWGTGIGLDVVSFYDFLFQLEYSFNSLNERGLFFNVNRYF